MKHILLITSLFLIGGSLCSCITGPIRRSVMGGDYESATAKWGKGRSGPVHAVATVSGFPTDVVIAAGDTIVIPVISVPLAACEAFDGAGRSFVSRAASFPIVFPVWYTWTLLKVSYCHNSWENRLVTREGMEKIIEQKERSDQGEGKGACHETPYNPVYSPTRQSKKGRLRYHSF